MLRLKVSTFRSMSTSTQMRRIQWRERLARKKANKKADMLIEIKKYKPEAEKFTHDQVGYEDPSTHPGQRCENCEHFINPTSTSPAGCEGVQRPIAESAWCHRYEKDENMKHHKFHKTTAEHHKDGSITIE